MHGVGRPGERRRTYSHQELRADLHLGHAWQSPVAKADRYQGSQIIYAIGWNGEYTGTDSKLPDRGFVSSPGSHHTWLRPNHNVVLQQIAYSRTATLKTDGDMPVDISTLNGIAALKTPTAVER